MLKFSFLVKDKISRVLIISFISSIFLFLFGLIDTRSLQASGLYLLIGLFSGILVGILEEFIVIKQFGKLNLLWNSIIKGTLYTVGAVLFLLSFAFLLYELDLVSYARITKFIYEGEFLRATFYVLFVTDFIVVFNQYQKFLGNNLLFWYPYGKYQYPEHEERIFMFLDISSSTSLAEEMPPDLYFAFVNEFYHDISEPLLKTSANIYQYVGDEVVFTWKMKKGLFENNCIKLFFLIEDIIKEKEKYYLNKFGHVPVFKAGVHCGKVIAAVVGDIKKELVYNGDVINTTSRIRSYCNIVGKKLLVSAELISKLENIDNEYRIDSLGIPKLKGKKNMVAIFSVERK